MQIPAQEPSTVTAEKLLQEGSRLSNSALDIFLDQALLMRAERRAPHLSQEETDLLLKINAGLSEEIWQNDTRLYAKLEADTITTEEHTELLRLIDMVEIDNAQRIENLIELAHLRGTTLDALMKALGIGPRSHA